MPHSGADMLLLLLNARKRLSFLNYVFLSSSDFVILFAYLICELMHLFLIFREPVCK